jgi:hypothetical protein
MATARIGTRGTAHVSRTRGVQGGQPAEIVDDRMAEILRGKTSAERIRIGFSLWEFARELLTARLSEAPAGRTKAEIEAEVSRRMSRGSW